MFFQKNYSTYLVSSLGNWTIWEIQIDLNNTPESDTWFLLIDKWVVWKEENIFYHRKNWNSVFFYWVNRNNPVTHDINASVLLANSIDALNYLSQVTQQQFYNNLMKSLWSLSSSYSKSSRYIWMKTKSNIDCKFKQLCICR